MPSLTSFSGDVPKNYETYLGPVFFEPYALDLVERFQVTEDIKRVLEIACGTGRVTNHLAAKLPASTQLTATDLNPEMLTIAGNIVPHNHVQWQAADAHELPFENNAFDAAVCQYGVMFFSDKPKAFAEISRVIKPGGIFLFNTWDELEHNVLSRLAQTVLEEIYPDDPPRFLDKGPYSFYNQEEIKSLLTNAGFSDIAIDVVRKIGTAATAEDAVTGILDGTPNFVYLAQRSLPSSIAKEKLAALLIDHFGETNLPLPMQALVIQARKI